MSCRNMDDGTRYKYRTYNDRRGLSEMCPVVVYSRLWSFVSSIDMINMNEYTYRLLISGNIITIISGDSAMPLADVDHVLFPKPPTGAPP